MIETMTKKIGEHSHNFNWSREDNTLHEPDCSLGFLEPTVSLYDDFEISIQSKSALYDDMPFSNLEYENIRFLPLLYDPAPKSSIPKDVTEYVLV